MLAANAYTSKDEFERDLKKVSELTQARSLDLIWLHRVEPKKWQYIHFPDDWTVVLCGPLDRLSEEDRSWWRAWIQPQFAKHIGEEVNIADAKEKLERLRAAYLELQTPPDEPDADWRRVGRVWVDANFDLDHLLATNGPIVALDDSRFQELAREEAGNPNGRVQMLLELDGYAILS